MDFTKADFNVSPNENIFYWYIKSSHYGLESGKDIKIDRKTLTVEPDFTK